MAIKTTMRYHLAQVIMAIIRVYNDSWSGWGGERTLPRYWWERKLSQHQGVTELTVELAILFQQYGGCFLLFIAVISNSATPWTAGVQATLSFTISQSLLKLMSTESVMPSNQYPLSSRSLPAHNLTHDQDLL